MDFLASWYADISSDVIAAYQVLPAIPVAVFPIAVGVYFVKKKAAPPKKKEKKKK